MLEPGSYKAKIKDYGFSQPKEAGKNPSAMVQFEVAVPAKGAESERTDSIMWFGSFNGGALKITLNTLVETLHFKGKTGAELVEGIGSGVLDEDTEYELEVEMNTYTFEKPTRASLPASRRT